MKVGLFIKWALVGFLGLFAIFLVLTQVGVFDCEPYDPFFGIARDTQYGCDRGCSHTSPLHVNTKKLQLDSWGLHATVGPWVCKECDPERVCYYSVEVKKAIMHEVFGECYYAFYVRELSPDKVPDFLMDKNSEELISFDPKTGTVHFDLTTTNFTCDVSAIVDRPSPGQAPE